MNHTKLINELLNELSYRVGIVDLKNKNQQSIISEILSEWGEYEAKQIIMEFLTNEDNADTEGDDKDYTHLGAGIYVRKGDEDKGTAQKYKKDDSGSLKAISDAEYQKTKSDQGEEGEKAAADTPQNQQGDDGASPEDVEKEKGVKKTIGPSSDYAKKEKERVDRVNGESDSKTTNVEKSDIEPIESDDIQGDVAKTDSGKTLYSLGNGYYSDSPSGKPKFIRTESVNEIQAKNQKGQTIQVEPISFEDLKKAAQEHKNKNFPDFAEKTPDGILNYLIGGKEDYKPISDSDFDDVREDSRNDASTGQNAGKGGASTTAQEEAAGLASEIALKNPNFTLDQIQEELERELINWSIYKGDSNEVSRIAKVSLGTVAIVKDIQDGENYGTQADGYPKPITFTGKLTVATAKLLVTKLKDAKENGDTDAVKHYEEELRAFAEYATSATGKEGDADTAVMYLDKNGRVRLDYITNKMSLGDMKLNTTKNVRAKNFIKNKVENASVEKLNKIQEIVSGKVKKMNQVAVEKLSFIREDLTLTKSRKQIPGSALNALYGRATFDVNGKYKKAVLKNPLIEKYLEDTYGKSAETASDSEILDAAFAVIGEKGADGLASNVKGAAGKMFIKLGTLWNDLDSKVKQQENKGVSGDQIYKNIVGITDKKTGKPLYGGSMSWEEIKELHGNKSVQKLAKIADSRGDSMKEAHADIVSDSKSVDIQYFVDQGMSQDEAEDRVNSDTEENGPNVETYVRTFMDEMHWTRTISGDADGRVHMSIGQYNVKPEHYRECFKTLTGYDGDVNTPEGKEGLINHLAKFCKITAGEASVDFVNSKTGKQVQLGQDTWRTAGDGEKVEGKDGKDLQNCLESKQ